MTYHYRSIVDQNIDPSPSLDDLLDDSVTSLFVPDVLGEKETLSTISDD